MKNYFLLLICCITAILSGCSKDDHKNISYRMFDKGSDVPYLKIGKWHKGGIIFYIDSTKQHGLIAAPYDQSEGIQWSNGNDTVRTIAFEWKIGTGKQNTAAIVNTLGPGQYAASICDNLVLNGYDDWYLPSFGELDLLYENQNAIGGFVKWWYWSSTDMGGYPHAYYARNMDFEHGIIKMNSMMFKGQTNRVRAIRSF